MNTCELYKNDRWMDFHMDQLPQKDKREMNEHRQSCPDCQKRYEELKPVESAAASIREVDLPSISSSRKDHLFDQAREKLSPPETRPAGSQQDHHSTKTHPFVPFKIWFPAAALVLIALGIGLYWTLLSPTPPPDRENGGGERHAADHIQQTKPLLSQRNIDPDRVDPGSLFTKSESTETAQGGLSKPGKAAGRGSTTLGGQGSNSDEPHSDSDKNKPMRFGAPGSNTSRTTPTVQLSGGFNETNPSPVRFDGRDLRKFDRNWSTLKILNNGVVVLENRSGAVMIRQRLVPSEWQAFKQFILQHREALLKNSSHRETIDQKKDWQLLLNINGDRNHRDVIQISVASEKNKQLEETIRTLLNKIHILIAALEKMD